MGKQAGWVASVIIAVVVGAASFRYVVPRKLSLTESELTSDSLPSHPAQPTTATVECSGGLAATLSDISGDWSVTQDHPPCTVFGIVLPPVKATAAEMAALKRRPQVAFQVAANGRVSSASLSRSSGSKTLDERALKQAISRRYQRHNCGVCKVSTVVDADFQGPVWMRESAQ